MEFETLVGMMEYVGFDERSAAILRELHPVARPSFESIVDDFYDTIERHPEARAAITGGGSQVERLKRTLVQWLDTALSGPHDETYLAARLRIGQAHVRIRLPQKFMFTAMNRIRVSLLRVIRLEVPEMKQEAAERAVNQLFDLELAIMLDSYREDLMTRVRANERLGTIGQLAASIGHELRNPLGIVESSLFLINSRLGKLQLADPTLQKHLTRIASQVTACSNTISGLLEMARDSQPDRTQRPVLPILEAALSSLQVPETVTLSHEGLAETLAYVDQQHLRQVFSNLVDNAVTAMGGAGTIQISASSDAKGVEIRVNDDGPGIPDELRDRVFDVLVTTRAHGTGLGLALCRKMIERHDGELSLCRGELPGACFRIWLPSAPA